jgi:hypothetical protein
MRHASWESATVNVDAQAGKVREDIKSDKWDTLSEQQHAIYFLLFFIPGDHV